MAKKAPVPALAEGLARARSLAAEMNSATDGLNTALQDVEKAITDLDLGVTARVLMQSEDDGPWCSFLCFGKERQVWRLLYEAGTDEEDWSSNPLVSTSRATRLIAVDFLLPLVEELIKTAGEEVEKVRAKADQVRQVAAKLREGAGASGGHEDIPF
jgi:hypothetical protein